MKETWSWKIYEEQFGPRYQDQPGQTTGGGAAEAPAAETVAPAAGADEQPAVRLPDGPPGDGNSDLPSPGVEVLP